MSEWMQEHDELVKDEAIVRMLERAPRIAVPEDFAARVMARVPVRSGVSAAAGLMPEVRGTRYGLRLLVVMLVVMLVAMFAVAPWVHVQDVWGVTLEMLLGAQFLGGAVWLSGRGTRA